MQLEKEDLSAVVREIVQELIPQLLAETQKVRPATMSVEQAAIYLGVHWQTVRKLIREKEIAHARIAGRIVIRPKALDDYLERLERESVQIEMTAV